MSSQGLRCPLCGSDAVRHMVLVHTVVWRCLSPNCSLRFAYPQPTDKELSLAYTSLYYPRNGDQNEVRFENTPKSTLSQVLSELEKRVGHLKGLKLLDYGCGRGALCQVAAEYGLKVTGIERDEQAMTVAKSIAGISVYSDIAQLWKCEPNSEFDVIILWTVIEHLRSPWEELAQLRSLLKPGGWLLISTMDIRCLRARLERARWENYANPTHLYYFDSQSLARVIQLGGFSELFEWRLKIRYPEHGFLRRWFYKISFSFRLSDGLFYLCRKSETSEKTLRPTAKANLPTIEPNRLAHSLPEAESNA